jgi:NAD(P)-dependent dehydrogenase (short-subunit alcohol dehydrogenase family)
MGQDRAMTERSGPFDATSTTDDVLEGVDLTGRRVLLTGASAGLGVETARALVAHGASVVAGVRDPAKATGALAAAGVPDGAVALRELDLASLASVRAFADGVASDHDGFDLLIANAGVMACPFGQTSDGFETQFGTNHLGHFVLVGRLAPLLADGARVVCLSSAGHRLGDVDLDDPNFEHRPYDEWEAYGQSKTANVLFAVELDRRLAGRGVRAAAVHPGMIYTELSRHMTESSLERLLELRGTRQIEPKSVPAGAATTVWAAAVADAEEVGGRYCEDCAVSPLIDDSNDAPGVMRYAVDPDRARALWARSEDLVGETFDL